MRRILPFMKVMQTAGLPENLVRDAEEELESPQEGLTYLEPTHDDPDAFERLYYSPVELQHNAKKARAKAAKWRKTTILVSAVLLVAVLALGFVWYLFQDARSGYNRIEYDFQTDVHEIEVNWGE